MKHIYKTLLAQHGGSIPFHILGGVQTSARTVQRRRGKRVRRGGKKNRTTSTRTTLHRRKLTHRRGKYNPDKYATGTIIRQNGQLMKLSHNKWIKI